ncbi:MAG: acetate kinase [Symploca sp. SIO1A3]|nr:acetate kinase [Symploca sp. SIO1A3]
MKILVLNAGSSTQKSCLYNIPDSTLPDLPPEPLWSGTVDWGKSADGAELTVKANGLKQIISLVTDSRSQPLTQLLNTLTQGNTAVLTSLDQIDIVGHRVVHGGTEYSQSTPISPEVKAAIARLIPLAPAHNPAHLEGIQAIEQILGSIPQLAVFDTAFHSQIPAKAAAYPIPYHWFEQGIRRYGFHGISHQYCARKAAQILGNPLDTLKLITCHLGNGASLAAVDKGISINTTMGFTPLEGLMMGTRSGSIDPAIGIYLMREQNFTVDHLDQMLNRESGLKGIFGSSGDMRAILAAIETGDTRAKLAFEMYIHRLQMGIGAMAASLGGVDGLVFTAGVGEQAAAVREATCAGLSFLGVTLDEEKNLANPVNVDIATPESRVRVLVVHTQEDWAIAGECWRYSKRQKAEGRGQKAKD